MVVRGGSIVVVSGGSIIVVCGGSIVVVQSWWFRSCKNWLSETAKILLQLDSLNQYDRFELQHQYVSINIKEVMSIQGFLHFT